MLIKATSANGITNQDVKYRDGIAECLKEIANIRRDMKRANGEIRRRETSARRTLDRIRSILTGVEATL